MESTVFCTLALFALAVAARMLTRDWIHPATIFPMLWGVNFVLTIVVAPENLISSSGPLWILLTSVFVVAGGVLGSRLAPTHFARRAALIPLPVSNERFRKITFFLTLLGILYVLVALKLQGIALSQLIHPSEFAKVALQMSLARYSGKMESSKVSQILLSFDYMVPFLGGALFVRRKCWRDTAIAFFSVVPSLAAFVAESTRSAVLYGATLWVAGYLTTRIAFSKPVSRMRLSRTQVILAVSTIPVLVGLIKIGDTLRSGGQSTAVRAGSSVVSDRAKVYLCGHVAALSIMLDTTDMDGQTAHLGQYTFAGIYELLHPGSRQVGINGDVIWVPDGSTNVFTYFWELILDYTKPGSLLVVFLFGGLAGYAYRKVGERSLMWNGVLAATYAVLIFGIACLLNYNSMILAFFMHWAVLARPWKRRGAPAWIE